MIDSCDVESTTFSPSLSIHDSWLISQQRQLPFGAGDVFFQQFSQSSPSLTLAFGTVTDVLHAHSHVQSPGDPPHLNDCDVQPTLMHCEASMQQPMQHAQVQHCEASLQPMQRSPVQDQGGLEKEAMFQLQSQQFQMLVMQCRNMTHFQKMFKPWLHPLHTCHPVLCHSLMKNLQPQTGPGQNIFFHFLSCWLSLHSSFFNHLFYHLHFFSFQVSFFMIFLIIVLSVFNHLFIIFHFVYHFCFQWCKNFPKNEKFQFSSVFSFFQFFSFFNILHHALSFFINSTTGSKND